MRKLTEEELEQVKKAISAKELTSAEILLEIYDHYVSHLESFGKEEFETELFELEEKFTTSYCQILESEFRREIKKGITKTQLKASISYFSFPKVLYTISIFGLLWLAGNQITSYQTIVGAVTSFLILYSAIIWLKINSYRKLAPLKEIFKGQNQPIASDLLYPISERMFIAVIILIGISMLIIYFLESLKTNFATSNTLVAFILLELLYIVSLLDVWKFKSKMGAI